MGLAEPFEFPADEEPSERGDDIAPSGWAAAALPVCEVYFYEPHNEGYLRLERNSNSHVYMSSVYNEVENSKGSNGLHIVGRGKVRVSSDPLTL